MKRTVFSVVVLLVLVGVTIYFNFSKPESTSITNSEIKASKGYLAPNFTISDVEGNTVSLADFRGKPVFINFWASWCPPCIEEMPYIEEAYTKYKDEIAFLMINVIETDTMSDMQAFMQENNYTFPVQLDNKNLVTDLYQVFGFPTSFFIDKNGVVADKVAGGMSEPMLNLLLQNILKD